MSDADDRIREDVATIKESMRWVIREIDGLHQKSDRTVNLVEKLNEFKWRMAGGAALVSILLAIAAQAMVQYLWH